MSAQAAKKDTLANARRKKKITLVAAAAFITILVLYGILRPSEDKEADQLKNAILALTEQEDSAAVKDPTKLIDIVRGKKAKAISKEELDKIKNTMSELSPKTRAVITREVMRARIDRLRKVTANMNDDEKNKVIQQMVSDIKTKFENMNLASREATKEQLNTEKGKEEAKQAFDVYYNDLNAEERKMFAPAVNELVKNLNAL